MKNSVVIPARMGHCHVKWYPGVFCKGRRMDTDETRTFLPGELQCQQVMIHLLYTEYIKKWYVETNLWLWERGKPEKGNPKNGLVSDVFLAILQIHRSVIESLTISANSCFSIKTFFHHSLPFDFCVLVHNGNIKVIISS